MKVERSNIASTPLPYSARIFLALCIGAPFVFALVWSQVKLFWIDELLQFYSDTRSSGWAVVLGQLHHPFSLEPPLYHLVLHYALCLAPHSPRFAARLPAIVLFAVTQWCLFRIVCRLTANWRAGVLAAFLPAALTAYLFSPEARVYELLTATFAVAVLSYCAGLQTTGRKRTQAFLVLFVALSLAVLSHYFGIFECLPFLLAEVLRSVRKRKVERAAYLAIVGSLCTFALNIPFLAGLHAVQARYYDLGQTAWNRIPFTYAWLFGRNNIYDQEAVDILVRHAAYVCFLGVLPCALASVALRRHRDIVGFASAGAGEEHEADRDAVLLVLFFGLLLPVVTVTVGHCVTHAYWPRYTVEAAVPVAACLALAVAPLLRGWCHLVLALELAGGVSGFLANLDYQHDSRMRAYQEATMTFSRQSSLCKTRTSTCSRWADF